MQKLTASDVMLCKQLHDDGLSYMAIGDKFDVTATAIFLAIKRYKEIMKDNQLHDFLLAHQDKNIATIVNEYRRAKGTLSRYKPVVLKWDSESDNKLKSMYKKQNILEIAEHFGISEMAVRMRAFKLGITRKCYQ